jgi:hypothetical protein
VPDSDKITIFSLIFGAFKGVSSQDQALILSSYLHVLLSYLPSSTALITQISKLACDIFEFVKVVDLGEEMLLPVLFVHLQAVECLDEYASMWITAFEEESTWANAFFQTATDVYPWIGLGAVLQFSQCLRNTKLLTDSCIASLQHCGVLSDVNWDGYLWSLSSSNHCVFFWSTIIQFIDILGYVGFFDIPYSIILPLTEFFQLGRLKIQLTVYSSWIPGINRFKLPKMRNLFDYSAQPFNKCSIQCISL